MSPSSGSYTSAFFLAVAVMLTQTAHTRAQSIEDARGLWFDADFEASRDAFVAVLASPALTVADARDAHRYLAVIALVLRDDAGAQSHADAAVALDREVAPPEGAPSSAAGLFRMARRRVGDAQATLTLESRAPLRYGARGVVVARMENAPPGLVGVLHIECGELDAEGLLPSISLDVQPTAAITCTASARTESGAVLFSVHRELEVIGVPVPVAQTSPTTQERADTSHRGRRWAIVGSVVALALAGAVTGVVVHDRNNADVEFRGTTVVGW